jgi:drug/metabolite transporter (DMT)-like permease
MSAAPSFVIGASLAVLAAMLFSVSNVLVRQVGAAARGPGAVATTLHLNLFAFAPLVLVLAWVSGAAVPDPRALGLAAVSGFFGLFLGRLTFFEAIALVGPSRASMTKNSSPVLVVLLAGLLLGRWPTPVAGLGVAAIVGGILLVGMSRAERSMRRDTNGGARGLVVALASAAVFAIGDVLRASALAGGGSALYAAVAAIAGAWVAAVLASPRAARSPVTALRSASRRMVVASALMGSAQLSSFVAIGFLFVPYVTALSATAPIFTALVSRVLARGDEELSRRLGAAMLMVVLGGAAIALRG